MLQPILHHEAVMAKHPEPQFHTDADYPPVTPDSIARAKQATRDERLRNGLDPDTGKFPDMPREEQWARATAIGELALMVNRFGAPRVQRWLRSIIGIDRPRGAIYLVSDELAEGCEEQ